MADTLNPKPWRASGGGDWTVFDENGRAIGGWVCPTNLVEVTIHGTEHVVSEEDVQAALRRALSEVARG